MLLPLRWLFCSVGPCRAGKRDGDGGGDKLGMKMKREKSVIIQIKEFIRNIMNSAAIAKSIEIVA